MRQRKQNVIIGYSDTARHYFNVGKALIQLFYQEEDYPPDDYDIEEMLREGILTTVRRLKAGEIASDEDDPVQQAALGVISKLGLDGIDLWVFDDAFDCVDIELTLDGVYQLILRENLSHATQ